jgi:uncharacterized protein (TIGR02757 family)
VTRAGPSRSLPKHLEALASRFPFDRSLPTDPLSQVVPFSRDRRAAEIAGIYASTLAVGNVRSIQLALGDLFRRMGGDPRGFVEGFPRRRWRMELYPWRHRWIRADQAGFLAVRLQEVYERYSAGLEEVFRTGMDAAEGPDPSERFAQGVHALSEALRWGSHDRAPTVFEPPPGYAQLFPSPKGPGAPACKREALFVRWMVRTGTPDLGLWRSVPASVLHVPLDTHVYWIARHLGLTRRSTRNWPTVVEVTEALRRIDPEDPVRFDFVLAHTGISGDCPKRRDLSICGRCSVRPDCDLWRGERLRLRVRRGEPVPLPPAGRARSGAAPLAPIRT